ncbi:MAG: hypothetical protein ABI178_01625 [Rhodanobacter sp.]
MPKSRASSQSSLQIDAVEASAYTVPTDQPETDGTREWDSTTIVIASVRSGDHTGIGYTYAHRGTALVIVDALRDALLGGCALDIPGLWTSMYRSIRNIGRPGMGLMAMAAVDQALWDLKDKLLGRSVIDLLGQARPSVPVRQRGLYVLVSQATATAARRLGRARNPPGQDEGGYESGGRSFPGACLAQGHWRRCQADGRRQ